MVEIVLLVLGVLLYAFMFHIVHDINPTHPWYLNQFWDKEVSWRNKYKNGDVEQGPAFFLSNNVLVSLTDGFHLIQALMWLCFESAFAWHLAQDWQFFIYLVAARTIRSTIFSFTYNSLDMLNEQKKRNFWNLILAAYMTRAFYIQVSVGILGFLGLAFFSQIHPVLDWVIAAAIIIPCGFLAKKFLDAIRG